ncbi:unnamed protein product [Blumeria hordei]|uniref:SAM-dependent MTase RsmB/NOP-type domain-containing protein n=1 Tax=Blumeria hordei TaxID=2867405 RepID=A0A383UUK9_BLUHO|nr:unnamed protein product [Blumeria hordei]
MGRGGKRGGFRGNRGGNRGDNRRGEDNRVSFDKVPKHNERLERYYNQVLGIDEEEKIEFWEALKRDLPNSFRFAGSKGHALSVQKRLKQYYVPQISAITNCDGTSFQPPQPIPWYPDELAWWMTASKSVVRRFPPFAAFQKYLVSETSVGNISRQEVVSMIPPLVMDLKPGMTVLDMCAAPGSKATQLLEMIHLGEEARMSNSRREYAQVDGREMSPDTSSNGGVDLCIDNDDYGRATGLLIANDSDYKRSHLLIHQLKRLSSPNLIVTNHDATMYPSIKLPPTPQNPSKNRYLKFDRILADVPCSGDGTTRKNVNLWRDWNPGSAIGLHNTQIRILVRALQMLKVGGRVVYSTCSMNPMENEAVISSAITRFGGLTKVKLISCDDQLPLLKRRPGLKNWCIMDKAGKVWSSWEELQNHIEEHGPTPETEKLLPGMFSPTSDTPEAQIPFNNCMRVYAHLQDTGGFFIAVLEKQSESKTIPEAEKSTHRSPDRFDSDVLEAKPIAKDVDDPIPTNIIQNLNQASVDTKDITDDKISINNHEFNLTEEFSALQRDSSPGTNNKRSIDISNVDASSIFLQKKSKITGEIPSFNEEKNDQHNISTNNQSQAETNFEQRPNRNRYGAVEEPFKYLPADHTEVQVIESFYGLSSRFPRDRFMVRNSIGQPAKTIYYTSKLIRDILTENEGQGIKFIHGGVKMFMKQDVQGPDVCKWRIQSEGMPILHGYVGEERIIRLRNKDTLRKLLIEMFPKVADGAWKELGEIGEQVRDAGMGCFVLRINLYSPEDGTEEKMVLPLWRSAASLNLMLAKEDRAAMLLRIFNDTTPLVNHSKEARAAAVERTLTTNLVNEPVDETINKDSIAYKSPTENQHIKIEESPTENKQIKIEESIEEPSISRDEALIAAEASSGGKGDYDEDVAKTNVTPTPERSV